MVNGLNGLQYTETTNDNNNPYNFIDERKSTAATILESKSYNKTGAITKYIINPATSLILLLVS
jgi:hypothetical protein